jgi:protoporphyrinogen oxidase
VVVIGGGLAGVTTAITAAEADPSLEVVMLEKSARLGGNRCDR